MPTEGFSAYRIIISGGTKGRGNVYLAIIQPLFSHLLVQGQQPKEDCPVDVKHLLTTFGGQPAPAYAMRRQEGVYAMMRH